MKEESFWEFKRKVKGKQQEIASEMVNEKGEMVSEKSKIVDVFKKFYVDLFKKPDKESFNEAQMKSESTVEKKIKNMKEVANTQEALTVTKKEINDVVRKLKRRKAPDSGGWRNEMLKEGGGEMIKSLKIIFNEIFRNMIIPEQWEKVTVKSIYKNKGKKTEMKNRRGIFLTNTVSKVFEKVLLNKAESKLNINKFQNGGQKERSTKDNWLALMAVLDKNREVGRDTYIICADAEKCFDQLWLDDCLVDLKDCGMRERETQLLKQLNQRARMTVLTPCGETEEFQVEEVVKQGTIFGPLLCCCNTSKIAEIGEDARTVVSPNLSIAPLTYVDDITAAGTPSLVKCVGRKLQIMEHEKRFTFNTGKTNYLIIKTGKRKEEVQELDMNVKRGKIERVASYKILGNWITEDGKLSEQLKEIEKRSWAMLNGLKGTVKEEWLGSMSTDAALLVYERTVVPTLIYNLECWTRIDKKEIEELERIQARILKSILRMPSSTPYFGILKETGIWPIEKKVVYHRMMLYQNLITSAKGRLGRVVIEDQDCSETAKTNNWASETRRIARDIGVDLNTAKEYKKELWKKTIKRKIAEQIERELDEKEMRKMRHQSGQRFERKSYLNKMGLKEASETMRRRLEMIDVGSNFGRKRTCRLCEEKESTEHMIACRSTTAPAELTVACLKETDDLNIIRQTNQFLNLQIEKRDKEEKLKETL